LKQENPNTLSKDNLKYLEQVCNDDFYKNDREFISIIKKLTRQSADMSNKALSLVSLLDEAERIKFDMVQKELTLSLDEKNKPYGFNQLKDVPHKTLIYVATSERKTKILMFISLLDKYFSLEESEDKRACILEAKELIESLKEHKVNAKRFIINSSRAKVWYLLESNFENTLRQFDIDVFIQKVRTTRMAHQSDVDEIQHFNSEKQNAIKVLRESRNQGASDEDIKKHQEAIEKELGTNIEPLLIDTKKIMDSLDFMLEDLPEALNPNQQNELKQFLPAISEFYIDQCYALSGGHSYTTLAKNLVQFQEDIDNNNCVRKLLLNVDKLEQTMQHLYILHWISESLLKYFFRCYNFKCTIGGLIYRYDKENKSSKLDVKEMHNAVKVRNNIAHNAVIWDPEKISFAIKVYRAYIDDFAKEQKIDLDTFTIPSSDRKLTEEQVNEYNLEYIKKHFKFDLEILKKDYISVYTYICETLERNSWSLDKNTSKILNRKIMLCKKTENNRLQDLFAQKYFQLSYEEVSNKLIEYSQSQSTDGNEVEVNKKAVSGLYWAWKNQCKPDVHDEINRIAEKIKGQNIWTKVFN